jgi:hypothetical protein
MDCCYFFSFQTCDAFLPDPEVAALFNQQFDLMIIDGVFTDCALALQYRMDIPFIFFNTISFAVDALSSSGNPIPYSVVPTHCLDLSDRMGFFQKFVDAGNSLGYKIIRKVRMLTSLPQG